MAGGEPGLKEGRSEKEGKRNSGRMEERGGGERIDKGE